MLIPANINILTIIAFLSFGASFNIIQNYTINLSVLMSLISSIDMLNHGIIR